MYIVLQTVLLSASFCKHVTTAQGHLITLAEKPGIIRALTAIAHDDNDEATGILQGHDTAKGMKVNTESVSFVQLSVFIKGVAVQTRKPEHQDKYPIAYFRNDLIKGVEFPTKPKLQGNFASTSLPVHNASVFERMKPGQKKRNTTKLVEEDPEGVEEPVSAVKDVVPSFFSSADRWEWSILAAVTVVLVLLDYFVVQAVIPGTFGWHLAAIAFWIAMALLFNVYVCFYRGGAEAFTWLTGYFLEWILSMENLFVFTLVFEAYKTPNKQMHKAVFIGIIGAALMRLVFYLVLNSLLDLFKWVSYILGALLIWSGIEIARGGEEDEYNVTDTRLVKGFKWMLGDRLRETYDDNGPSIFAWSDQGHLQVTVLFLVIWCIEVVDIVFAVDSVSAKLTQIKSEYLSFSSTILAMFGLRAAFFIIHDLVEMFETFKYGLCVILIFVGVDLLWSPWIDLSTIAVCMVIICVFVVSIVLSLLKQGSNAEKEHGCPAEHLIRESDTKTV